MTLKCTPPAIDLREWNDIIMKANIRICGMVLFCIIFLFGCAGEGLRSADETFHDAPYWDGEINVGGLTWRVGLEPAPDNAPLVDVISSWRARQPATSFTISNDGNLEIGLPADLGAITITAADAKHLNGAVLRKDGATGTFKAIPGTRIKTETVSMKVEGNGATIAATLTKPLGKGPFPVIVMIHGSGDSDRKVEPYRFWADYFSQQSIAVLLYDKRGNGESTGNWRDVGFMPRASDVSAIVDYLSEQSYIRTEAIGLMGVSQGVWVAGLAAQKNPNVDFMISVSGPAVTPAQSDGYAGWVYSQQVGLSPTDADERRALFFLYLEAVRAPKSDAAWLRLNEALSQAKQKAWFEQRPLDPGPRESLSLGWYPLVMDHDPVPVLKAVEIPILWLYGENDTQLNAEESATILNGLKAGGKDYNIHVFEQAGHGIAVPIGDDWQSADYMTSAPGFFEAIDNFVSKF